LLLCQLIFETVLVFVGVGRKYLDFLLQQFLGALDGVIFDGELLELGSELMGGLFEGLDLGLFLFLLES
jgi:hypothetical protein